MKVDLAIYAVVAVLVAFAVLNAGWQLGALVVAAVLFVAWQARRYL